MQTTQQIDPIKNPQIDSIEIFDRAIGFTQQAYYFFASCLPSDKDQFPKKISGIYFESMDHVKVYENELSYSFLLRIFGALGELCIRLGIKETDIPKKLDSYDKKYLKLEYEKVKIIRNTIMHANGDVVAISKGSNFQNFPNDRNGDIRILLVDIDKFVSIISLVAKELSQHAGAGAAT